MQKELEDIVTIVKRNLDSQTYYCDLRIITSITDMISALDGKIKTERDELLIKLGEWYIGHTHKVDFLYITPDKQRQYEELMSKLKEIE